MAVIVAQNISKKYIIDHQKAARRGRNFRDTFSEKFKHFFGKGQEDEVEQEEFWALRNVDFTVNQGDVVGIVGHNGAGKSTLLKVLSKITEPTEGRVSIKGRVASLLEVGTGFHPELTGRENIFLNGSILGMRRQEIKEAFDSIVDFAGIEKFLDTPVKRYSSGMYVRLGFAISAHLSPEILIIDEVLAVGDADFQKKCLGKMRDVSQSGRTILFVSHNMAAVQSLCNRAFYFEHGLLKMEGDTTHVVNNYLSHVAKTQLERYWETPEEGPGSDEVRFRLVKVAPEYQPGKQYIDVRTPLKVQIEFWNMEERANLNLSLHLYAFTGECIFNVGTTSQPFDKGLVSATLDIPGNFLNDGSYMISVMVVKDTSSVLYQFSDAVSFEVEDHREGVTWYGKWPGYVRPQFNFQISQAEVLV
ncbi:MAG: ABC transporter ATP-binding protein [Spirosomaceae bacterium]|nr:ABC transporter ATP-binding protein [Spirosomataceae bacterium]